MALLSNKNWGILTLSLIFLGCDYVKSGKHSSWTHFKEGGMLAIGSPCICEGGLVYFVSGATGHGDIYQFNIRNASVTRITSTNNFEGNPTISNDGKTLAFSRELDGTSAVYILDTESGSERQITEGKFIEEPIAILGDGAHILISVSKSQLLGQGGVRHYEIMRITEPINTRTNLGIFVVVNQSGTQLLSYDETGIMHLSGDDFENSVKVEIPFAGHPLALSNDGIYIVLSKQRTDGQWKLDNELYLLNRKTNRLLKIGEGHSAVMDNANQLVVFSSGYGNVLSCFSIGNEVTRQVAVNQSYKSTLRTNWNGSSVVFGSVSDNRAEFYDIVEVPFATLRPSVVYSVGNEISR